MTEPRGAGMFASAEAYDRFIGWARLRVGETPFELTARAWIVTGTVD